MRAPFYAVAGLGLLSAVHAFRALEETKPATTPQKTEQKETGRLRDVLADAPFASAALAHATTFALRQGGRPEQQDRVLVEKAPGVGLIVGVFDGHGGAEAAELASKDLWPCLLYTSPSPRDRG